MKLQNALFLFPLLSPAQPQEQSPSLRELASKVKDYPTKFRLIAIGRPAVPPLMAQVGSEDPWLAFESKSALRWIANHSLGRPEEQKALARDFSGYCDRKHPEALRALAAEILGDLGMEDGVENLASMLEEEPLREVAFASLRRIPGPKATKALVVHLKRSEAAARVPILHALGERGDPAAAPALKKAAAEGSSEAISALWDLADRQPADVATDLVRASYKAARDPGKKFEALCRRARLGDEGAAAPLIEITKAGSEGHGEKAWHALLSLADRLPSDRALHFYDRALLECSEPGVAARAISGFSRIPTEATVRRIQTYLHSESENLRTTAFAVLRDLPGKAATVALIAGARGERGAPLLPLVVEALGTRGEPEGALALRQWILTGPPEIRGAAMESLLQIAARLEEKEARETYHFSLERGVTEAGLRGAGRTGDGETLSLLEPLVGKTEGELRNALADALVRIGDRLASRKESAEAKRALRTALEAGAAVENRLRALGERTEITARGGRVDAWWVIGPFEAPDEGSWGKAEFPEKEVELAKENDSGGRTIRWQPVQSTAENSVVDLDSLLSPNDRVAAYAYAEIVTSKEADATLLMGSDDGLACWLNGERVYSKLVPRGFVPDEDKVPVKLREGSNDLLIKICEGGGAWSFCARLEDEKGRPLKFKIR